MPRTCSVCGHGQRAAIDKALLAGGSFRSIAAQFGVGASALLRHKAHIRRAVQEQEALTVARLLDDLQALQTRALQLLGKAEDANDLRAALAGIREVRGVIETSARLLEASDLEARIAALEKSLRGREETWG